MNKEIEELKNKITYYDLNIPKVPDFFVLRYSYSPIFIPCGGALTLWVQFSNPVRHSLTDN